MMDLYSDFRSEDTEVLVVVTIIIIIIISPIAMLCQSAWQCTHQVSAQRTQMTTVLLQSEMSAVHCEARRGGLHSSDGGDSRVEKVGVTSTRTATLLDVTTQALFIEIVERVDVHLPRCIPVSVTLSATSSVWYRRVQRPTRHIIGHCGHDFTGQMTQPTVSLSHTTVGQTRSLQMTSILFQ